MLEAELSYQATVYREAQSKHLEAKEQFDRQVKELYRVREDYNLRSIMRTFLPPGYPS